MPTYEFRCEDCQKVYEELTTFDKTNKYPKVVCPKCSSSNKTRLISGCSFAFSDPVGTDRWNNTSSGHDYRFQYKLPEVKQERAIAEAVSHMGSDPYGGVLKEDQNMDEGIHDAEFRRGLS